MLINLIEYLIYPSRGYTVYGFLPSYTRALLYILLYQLIRATVTPNFLLLSTFFKPKLSIRLRHV